ncbi:putative histidine kinase 6 [Diplonema papillatum]|nr:putative histidine kinase 6 [Diplonema papillatum]
MAAGDDAAKTSAAAARSAAALCETTAEGFGIEIPRRLLLKFTNEQPSLVVAQRATPRVLVVEDNVFQGGSAKAVLEKRGFVVHWERDGPSALAAVQQQSFDAAFIDIKLPGMSGIELTARLRTAEMRANRASGVQRLLIFGTLPEPFDNSHCIGLCRDCGMDRYVRKPLVLHAPMLCDMFLLSKSTLQADFRNVVIGMNWTSRYSAIRRLFDRSSSPTDGAAEQSKDATPNEPRRETPFQPPPGEAAGVETGAPEFSAFASDAERKQLQLISHLSSEGAERAALLKHFSRQRQEEMVNLQHKHRLLSREHLLLLQKTRRIEAQTDQLKAALAASEARDFSPNAGLPVVTPESQRREADLLQSNRLLQDEVTKLKVDIKNLIATGGRESKKKLRLVFEKVNAERYRNSCLETSLMAAEDFRSMHDARNFYDCVAGDPARHAVKPESRSFFRTELRRLFSLTDHYAKQAAALASPAFAAQVVANLAETEDIPTRLITGLVRGLSEAVSLEVEADTESLSTPDDDPWKVAKEMFLTREHDLWGKLADAWAHCPQAERKGAGGTRSRKRNDPWLGVLQPVRKLYYAIGSELVQDTESQTEDVASPTPSAVKASDTCLACRQRVSLNSALSPLLAAPSPPKQNARNSVQRTPPDTAASCRRSQVSPAGTHRASRLPAAGPEDDGTFFLTQPAAGRDSIRQQLSSRMTAATSLTRLIHSRRGRRRRSSRGGDSSKRRERRAGQRKKRRRNRALKAVQNDASTLHELVAPNEDESWVDELLFDFSASAIPGSSFARCGSSASLSLSGSRSGADTLSQSSTPSLDGSGCSTPPSDRSYTDDPATCALEQLKQCILEKLAEAREGHAPLLAAKLLARIDPKIERLRHLLDLEQEGRDSPPGENAEVDDEAAAGEPDGARFIERYGGGEPREAVDRFVNVAWAVLGGATQLVLDMRQRAKGDSALLDGLRQEVEDLRLTADELQADRAAGMHAQRVANGVDEDGWGGFVALPQIPHASENFTAASTLDDSSPRGGPSPLQDGSSPPSPEGSTSLTVHERALLRFALPKHWFLRAKELQDASPLKVTGLLDTQVSDRHTDTLGSNSAHAVLKPIAAVGTVHTEHSIKERQTIQRRHPAVKLGKIEAGTSKELSEVAKRARSPPYFRGHQPDIELGIGMSYRASARAPPANQRKRSPEISAALLSSKSYNHHFTSSVLPPRARLKAFEAPPQKMGDLPKKDALTCTAIAAAGTATPAPPPRPQPARLPRRGHV